MIASAHQVQQSVIFKGHHDGVASKKEKIVGVAHRSDCVRFFPDIGIAGKHDQRDVTVEFLQPGKVEPPVLGDDEQRDPRHAPLIEFDRSKKFFSAPAVDQGDRQLIDTIGGMGITSGIDSIVSCHSPRIPYLPAGRSPLYESFPE